VRKLFHVVVYDSRVYNIIYAVFVLRETHKSDDLRLCYSAAVDEDISREYRHFTGTHKTLETRVENTLVYIPTCVPMYNIILYTCVCVCVRSM